MTRYGAMLALAAVLVLSVAAAVSPAADTAQKVFTGTGGTIKSGPGDWPQWRGPNRDGLSAETGILRKWPQAGRRCSGTSTPWAAASPASPSSAIASTPWATGRQMLGPLLDLGTQKLLWSTPLDQAITDGPRCTPTVDGDRLYVMAASSLIACLNTATAKSSGSGT